MAKYYVRYARIEGIENDNKQYLIHALIDDCFYVGDKEGDSYYSTTFTAEELVALPASIHEAIGKGVLVLEEVE